MCQQHSESETRVKRIASFDKALAEDGYIFSSDDSFLDSLVFRLVSKFSNWCVWNFHSMTFEGGEHLPPPGSGALFVGIHSTHSQEVLPALLKLAGDTGRVPRALVHRQVARLVP